MNKNIFLKISVIVFIFALVTISIIYKPIGQDEGVFLTIGRGLAEGFRPYRDYFDHKPPGIYLLFGLLSSFTENILAFKTMLLIAHILAIILILKISRRLYISAFYSTLFYLSLILIYEGEKLIAEPFGALFLLLALYVYLLDKKSTSSILAGFLMGISILFKQTFLLSLFAFALYLIWQKRYRDLLYVFVGCLLPVIATLVWLYASGLLIPAYEQIILYNFRFYPAEDLLKVIRLLIVPFLYTLPVWILFASKIIRLPRRPSNQLAPRNDSKSAISSLAVEQIRDPLVMIVLFATLPIPFFFLRHYPHYWLQIVPFVALVASITICKMSLNIKRLTSIFLLLACTIFISLSFKENYSHYLAERRLSDYLKLQNMPIYAENQFTGMYFLTEHTPPNKYLYITEITDWSEQAEEKTIETLKNNDYLIIWPTDSNYPYARNLQSYIFENYKAIHWDSELGAVVYSPQKDDEFTK